MSPSSRRRFGATLFCASLLLSLTVCERAMVTAPDMSGPISVRVVSGDAQRAVFGTELPLPIVVQALNSKGKALKGQIVNFVVVSGGGSVYAGTSITNDNGIAQEYWTMGPVPGANRLEVRAVDPSTGAKQNFATMTALGTLVPVATMIMEPTQMTIQAGELVLFTVSLFDAAGNALTDREVTWSSSNEAVATVNEGAVFGNAQGGPVTITATSDGRSATAQVTVTRAHVAFVQVDPNNLQIGLGETFQLTARPYDNAGRELIGRIVTWSSSTDEIATVSGAGLVTGLRDGWVVISATSEGVREGANVHVVAAIASISIQPTSLTLHLDHPASVEAILRDVNGNPISNRPVQWTSSNQLIAYPVIAGELVWIQPVAIGGPVIITASAEGVSRTISVTVVPFSPDQYEPNDAGSSAFTLETAYDDGNEVVVNPTIFPDGDQDWFRITASERSTIACVPGTTEMFTLTVSLSSTQPGVDNDLDVRLGSPTGDLITSQLLGNEQIAYVVSGTCGVSDSFTFYIRVFPFGIPSTEPYRLGVKFRRN